ncbi:MAG: DUF2341 domain-containing protein [Nanopusillaceae archaeon]
MDRGTKILLFIIAILAIYIVYRNIFPVAQAYRYIGPLKVVEGPWLEGWKYRLPVDIGPNTGEDITDTVGVVVIDTKTLIDLGLMKQDCSDIRVTDSDGVTLLPFWVQPDSCHSGNPLVYGYSGNTLIYVRLPEVKGGEKKRVYIYFGNSEAESASNGEAVFAFFDDFDKEEIDLNKWQISDGTAGDRIYVVGGKLYIESDGISPIKTIATRERVVKQNSAVIAKVAPVSIPSGQRFGVVLVNSLSFPNGVAYMIEGGYFTHDFGYEYNTREILQTISGGSWGGSTIVVNTHRQYYRVAVIERKGTTAYLSVRESTGSRSFPSNEELYIVIPRMWNERVGNRGVFAVDFIAVIENYNEKLIGAVTKNIISTVEVHKNIFDVDVLIPSDKIYFTNQIPLRFRVVSGETGTLRVFINDKEIRSFVISGGFVKIVEIPFTEISRYINKEGNYIIRFRFERGNLVREITHEFIYSIPGSYRDPKYRYRIPIVIEERSGRDLVDVVIPLRLNLGEYIKSGMMRSDCLDIMFTDYDGYTRIPFWVEKCNDKDWKIIEKQVTVETRADYSIGTTDLELRDNINFPETPISYGDNYYNTYDPWTCNYCSMYIRVYLKYNPSDGSGPQVASIRIRSDDDQALWVNGKLVGYGPIGTKTYDIKQYIVPGDNEIWIWCKEYTGDEYCFFDIEIDEIYITKNGVYSDTFKGIEEEGSLIWVRIPKIAALNNHTIYMYFGSNYLTVGDPYKVFDIYENFSLKTTLDNWDVYTQVMWGSMPSYTVRVTENALRVYVSDVAYSQGALAVVHRKVIRPCNKKVEFEAKFLPNNPQYRLPHGRLYFIGLAEQAILVQDAVGFFSSDWHGISEKTFAREYYNTPEENPVEFRHIMPYNYRDIVAQYTPSRRLEDERYIIDIVISDKLLKSKWYRADGKVLYQKAYKDEGITKCSIPMRLAVHAATWCDWCQNAAEIYLYWIRVYNHYEPEPKVYQLSLGDKPNREPRIGEIYEEVVLEYIRQQQPQQPPEEQPPTYQPPTQQPPTYQPPTYQPPIQEQPTQQPVYQQPVTQQPTPQPIPGVQTVIEYIYKQPLLVIAIIILVIAILLATIRK